MAARGGRPAFLRGAWGKRSPHQGDAAWMPCQLVPNQPAGYSFVRMSSVPRWGIAFGSFADLYCLVVGGEEAAGHQGKRQLQFSIWNLCVHPLMICLAAAHSQILLVVAYFCIGIFGGYAALHLHGPPPRIHQSNPLLPPHIAHSHENMHFFLGKCSFLLRGGMP